MELNSSALKHPGMLISNNSSKIYKHNLQVWLQLADFEGKVYFNQ